MKSALVLPLFLGLLCLGANAHAAETVSEKAQATVNDAKRAVDKAAHRAQEATCLQSDVKCLEQKAAHRLEEARDYTTDKAKEIKNEIDDDRAE